MAKKEKVEKPIKGPFKASREKLRKIKSKHVLLAFVIDTLVILVSALAISFLIKTFLIRTFYIPSGSMFDTLQINDRIMVNQLVPDIIPLERGDVVVFKDPGGWLGVVEKKPITNPIAQVGDFLLSVAGLTTPDNNQHLVKRVIGKGGDRVVCCDVDNRITINGKAIIEPYLAKDSNPSNTEFDVTVPKDSFWVLGDNRGNSEDSRYHADTPGRGFVSKNYVVGRAFVISWPFQHFTWLDNYPNVFKDVPTPKP
jgi:signal peptidase I